MALIKYRQNGEWVTIPLTATEISPDIVINSSQITISNIDSSASGNVNSGDSLSVAISKIINQIKDGVTADIDLSEYYKKIESDARYVQAEPGKGLSTEDFTTALKNKLNSLNNYTLPQATSSILGGVKIGTGVNIGADGTISVDSTDLSAYITADQISNQYVKKESGKGLSSNDFTNAEKLKLQGLQNYTLPIATADALGGIKVGSGLKIDGSGVLTANVTSTGDLDLSDYYTKEQVNSQISSIPKFAISVVTALPSSEISNTTVYLVRNTDSEDRNMYTEYIYVNGVWETLGAQKVDLTDYLTKDEADSKYIDESELTVNLGDYITKTEANETYISKTEPLELPIASSNRLGGVKIGAGVNIGGDGTISVTPTDLSAYYTKVEVDNAIQQATGDAVQVTYYTTTEIDSLFEAAQATLPDADTMKF